MKKIILILSVLVLSYSCKAQNDHLNHVTQDKVKFNNLFDYDTTPGTVKSRIGNPISITSEFNEMQDTNASVYNYNGLKISFINNIIYDFEIINNNYSLFIDGLEIKIGDPISVIKNKFSKSYNSRDPNEGAGIIVHDCDCAIILYISNDTITKIENQNF